MIRWFEAVARKHADLPAVMQDGVTALTYAELDRRSRRLAGGMGAAPGQLVALGFPRSVALVEAILATWRAGAAFVVVPPDLPPARRAAILEQADVHVDRLPEEGPELSRDPEPEDLAYVVYTSGSTGRPKGVEVEHGALARVIEAQIAAFGLGPGCRPLWVLHPAFDASLSDLFTALLSGAALALESELPPPGPEMSALLDRRGITHLDLPPSFLPLMDPPALHTAIVGGEPAPPEAVRRWAAHCRVLNVYGPTEATICSSLGPCGPDWEEPLLGRPLPGVTYSVRDEAGDPLPPGAPGELWIGGATLARGYRGDPERTARAFPEAEGGRWYRTGDRVVERPDGEFRFLGRQDRQVKIRGVRIEPEEVEAVLREFPGVTGAAVVPVLRGGRATGLAACVEGLVDGTSLRAWLEERLPPAMVPGRLEVRASLPRTPSGKVDLAIAALWEAALGHAPQAGVPWAEQGGDSLGLLQLAVSFAAAGYPVDPGDLARHDTPEAQDRLLRERRRPRSTRWLRREAQALVKAGGPAGDRLLLTGATGFLGSRVLLGLLQQTDVPITALVRAADPDHGRRRLEAALGRPLDRRVEVLPGDLERLPDDLGTVIHCAARLNTAASFEGLRAANLDPVARLAGTRLVHASTLSVLAATDRPPGLMLESEPLDGARHVYGGYAQTKWAAEALLEGTSAVVLRFGQLTGDSVTGRGAPADFLARFLRGLASLGRLPRGDWEALRMDVTPVDYAAAATVALALRGEGVYHVNGAGTASLADLVRALERRGHRVRAVSRREWRALAPEEAVAWLGAARLLPAREFRAFRGVDLFLATGFRFDDARTRAATGLACPPVTDRLLDLYVEHAL